MTLVETVLGDEEVVILREVVLIDEMETPLLRSGAKLLAVFDEAAEGLVTSSSLRFC